MQFKKLIWISHPGDQEAIKVGKPFIIPWPHQQPCHSLTEGDGVVGHGIMNGFPTLIRFPHDLWYPNQFLKLHYHTQGPHAYLSYKPLFATNQQP